MTTITAIYGARKAAGLDDESARDIYARAVGKRYLREMSPGEQVRVLQELNRLPRSTSERLIGKYAEKLQALWLDGWHLGVITDRRDSALMAFVRRQAHVDHTRFLIDAKEAQKVIEALKSWFARAAGVEWNDHSDPKDAVIAAQGRLLKLDCADLPNYPQSANAPLQGFCAWRNDELGRGEKIRVMQLLGDRIRRQKAVR